MAAGRTADARREDPGGRVAAPWGAWARTTCEAVAADAELELVAAVDPAFAGRRGGRARRWPDDAGAVDVRRALEAALAAVPIDVVVDFTMPGGGPRERPDLRRRTGCRWWWGPPGWRPATWPRSSERPPTARVPVLVAPNFAMGAVLMMQFAQQAAEHFGACEIVELHHDSKLDAPSGTSRLTRLRVEEAWREAGLEQGGPHPQRAAARAGGAPGGHLRRPGGDPHHPARLPVPGIVHARGASWRSSASAVCKDSSSVWRTFYRTATAPAWRRSAARLVTDLARGGIDPTRD